MEALVGMLVLSLALGGSLVALGKGAKLQYSNNIRAQVIDQIRAQAQAGGIALCGTSIPVRAGSGALTAAVTCTPYANVSVVFPGLAAPVSVVVPMSRAQILTAKISSPMLGGTMTVSSAR